MPLTDECPASPEETATAIPADDEAVEDRGCPDYFAELVTEILAGAQRVRCEAEDMAAELLALAEADTGGDADSIHPEDAASVEHTLGSDGEKPAEFLLADEEAEEGAGLAEFSAVVIEADKVVAGALRVSREAEAMAAEIRARTEAETAGGIAPRPEPEEAAVPDEPPAEPPLGNMAPPVEAAAECCRDDESSEPPAAPNLAEIWPENEGCGNAENDPSDNAGTSELFRRIARGSRKRPSGADSPAAPREEEEDGHG